MNIADRHHRFGAFVIDWHIRTIPIALWGFWLFFKWFPLLLQSTAGGRPALADLWQLFLPLLDDPGVAMLGWLSVAAYLLYHPLFELAMHGNTPGKRMMGIRVVGLDGGAPSVRQVLVRAVWREIEFLPVAYLWGMLAIWRSPENARTGDVIADTRVVND